MITAERISQGLATRWAGRGMLVCAGEMPSTNTVLRELARQGAPHGSIAVCDHQTAGKGRIGRSWETPAGEALTFSLLLRPKLQPEQAQLCTLAAALAMAQAVGDCCPGLRPRIKWPNDLVIGQGKCCGILSEMGMAGAALGYVVTGVGLNVNQLSFPEELQGKAVSLLGEMRRQDAAVKPLSRVKLLQSFLAHMENAVAALETGGFTAIRPAYEGLSATVGHQVQIIAPDRSFTAHAAGIGENGALLVTHPNGQTEQILCGDVSVRGLMGYV